MSALKNFAITFLISATVFGIVAYFVVGFMTSTVRGILEAEHDRLDDLITEEVQDSTDDGPVSPDEIPNVKGESFTVLFGVTDRREELFDYYPEDDEFFDALETGDEDYVGLLSKDYQTVKLKSIVLMRVSKETGNYTFIPLPSISKVYTQMGSGYTLLEDVMYLYDVDYFTQKVSAMTGITPDYTVFANVTDLDDILDVTGGFTCYIPEDIYTDGKNYFNAAEADALKTAEPETEAPDKDDKDNDGDDKEKVVIEKVVTAGNVTIGASNIEAIMLFENYEDGVESRSELICNILKGFIGRLSALDDEGLAELYNELNKEEKIDTNMRETELLAKAEIIRAYEDFIVNVAEYPGAMSGDYFVPDIMEAAEKFLGLRLPPDPERDK